MPVARACAALLIALLVASAAHADPTFEGGPRVPDKLSDLETGRLLLRAGRLAHARVFLEQADPANEAERIERLLLLGRIDMRLGMPREAAERFEAILEARPDLTRVRLELARAYYLAGRFDKAQYHFNASLGEELPFRIEAAVEGLLRRIDARRRWSVSVSAAMLPETRRPQRQSVLIGGVPFRLNEDATTPSGVGALLSGGLSFSSRVSERVRGVVAASSAAKLYERSSWNELSASGELGFTRVLKRGTASAGLGAARVWTGGDPERVDLGPWARSAWQLSSSTRAAIALSADRRRYDSLRARDGWRLRASPRIGHAFDSRTTIAVEPVLEAVTAKKNQHGSRLIGLGAIGSHAFHGGVSIALSAAAEVRRHAGPDALFGTTREDRTTRLGLRVLHQAFGYRGFSPYLGYSLERNRSTIPIHEYRIHGLVAGVSRTF